jgi:Ca2+-binding EF-hand superfamily protein
MGLFSGTAQANAYDRIFARADINNSNSLSMAEFMSTQAGSARWTDAAYRFNANDLDRNGFLSELEFRGSRGGRDGGRPTKLETFILADLDDDGSLDPSEFALTLPQTWNARKVSHAFDVRDKNDNALISSREFGLLGLPA